jgi:hypothetical protein
VSVTTTPGVYPVQVEASSLFTCALLSDGTLKCWGLGFYGQLGYGTPDSVGIYDRPSDVGVVSVTTTPGVVVTKLWGPPCVLLSDLTLKCWGPDHFGSLGYGQLSAAVGDHLGDGELPSDFGPVIVTNRPGISVSDMGGAMQRVCAVLSDGLFRCWSGTWGEYELPTAFPERSASATPGVGVVQVKGGGRHACVLLSDGSMKCWGDNSYGQLGYGNTNPIPEDADLTALPPVSVTTSPGVRVKHIALGGSSTCALLSNGELRCWGRNDTGLLGTGSAEIIGDNELPSSMPPLRFF